MLTFTKITSFSNASAKNNRTMTKKRFLVFLLLCISVHGQDTNNENLKEQVETIPQLADQQPGASAPAQANDLPVNEISPNNPNYGKNILKKTWHVTNLLGIILEQSYMLLCNIKNDITCR